MHIFMKSDIEIFADSLTGRYQSSRLSGVLRIIQR